MSKTENVLALRVLIRPSEQPDRWVAVCIDRYMVAEGDSPESAAQALDMVLRAEMSYGVELGYRRDPLERLPSAPHKYHDAFEAGIVPPPPRRRKTQQHVSLEFEQRLMPQPA